MTHNGYPGNPEQAPASPRAIEGLYRSTAELMTEVMEREDGIENRQTARPLEATNDGVPMFAEQPRGILRVHNLDASTEAGVDIVAAMYYQPIVQAFRLQAGDEMQIRYGAEGVGPDSEPFDPYVEFHVVRPEEDVEVGGLEQDEVVVLDKRWENGFEQFDAAHMSPEDDDPTYEFQMLEAGDSLDVSSDLPPLGSLDCKALQLMVDGLKVRVARGIDRAA